MKMIRVLLGGALASGFAGATRAGPPAPPPFRIAVTSNMFTEVSQTDGRAAMKAWILTVAKEKRIPVDEDPMVYGSIEDAFEAAQSGRIDGFGLTMGEYARIARTIRFDRLALSIVGESETESYVLLVHRDSSVTNLAGLAGRRINLLQTPRTCLALLWLDTLMLEAGLKPAQAFAVLGTRSAKPTQVALPVYFRQADACLMTRRSLQTMVELNPDLGRKLCVLASSAEFVPSGFAFCAENPSPLRPQILEALRTLGDSAAGRQILTLTKSDRMVERPISYLDPTLAMIAHHEELMRRHLSGAGGGP